MTSREYPRDIFQTLDANRRVAWAKFYEEADDARRLASINAALRSELYDFVAIVLEGKPAEAFARAYRIRDLLDNGPPAA